MSQAIGARAIRINGTEVLFREGATFRPGSPTREPVTGPGGVHGYQLGRQAAQLDVQITDQSGQSTRAFAELTDATISIESENGKSYVMSGTWQGGAVELDATEGAVSYVFYSSTWEEIGVT